MLRSHLTYANVVASVALFITLGGTSVAATNLISGNKIKTNSIPANRIKPHSLTQAQMNLGTVAHAVLADNATVAGTATNAAHAGEADHAARAGDADTLGGQPASVFAPAGRVQIGSAATTSPTVKVFFDSPLGFRLETDGNANFDKSVTVRNTGANTLGVVGTTTVVALKTGGTVVIDGNHLGYAGAVSDFEARFIVQSSAAPGNESLVDCIFPAAGSGEVRALCTATQTV